MHPHTSWGYWATTGEHLAQSLLRPDFSQHFEHKDQEAARPHVRAQLISSISQKHCFVIICSHHPGTPKGSEGTVDRKTGGGSGGWIRKECQGYLQVSARETVHLYVWIGARMWKGRLGIMTVKPYRQTEATATVSSDSAWHKPDSDQKLFRAEI